jgi:predicted nucleic acid-binding protein
VRLLDTDVMVDIRREYPPAVAWLTTLSELPGLPGLVVMELVEGCHDGREVRHLLRELALFPVYWPSTADQERALGTFARAHLSHRLGLLDALIGECAAGLAATLCTFNVRHFRAVPQLSTEQPYSRS